MYCSLIYDLYYIIYVRLVRARLIVSLKLDRFIMRKLKKATLTLTIRQWAARDDENKFAIFKVCGPVRIQLSPPFLPLPPPSLISASLVPCYKLHRQTIKEQGSCSHCRIKIPSDLPRERNGRAFMRIIEKM